MRTKAVYVVVSGNSDIYFEQAWVSAWSLKHYNPNMRVECVVDRDTYNNILGSYRKKALEVIDEIVRIEIPIHFNRKKQSRWLKTNLRSLVKGDYIFIDTDTIICDKLDEIDDFEYDVMMVQDSHCPLSKISSKVVIQNQIEAICGKEIKTERYFNSGVIFCKDTPKARTLYEEWNRRWQESCKRGIYFDQKALAVALEGRDDVQEMSGIYNCQIRFSIRFLHKAKIIHFFNSNVYQDCINPFLGKDVYNHVKEEGRISPHIQEMIIDCKSLFIAPSLTIAEEELKIRNSKAFELLKAAYNHSTFYYTSLIKLSKIQLVVLSSVSHIVKKLKRLLTC